MTTSTTARVFLGVDAGNSKTVALACDETGRVLGYGRGGTGDIYGVKSEQHAVDEVLGCVKAALTMAGRQASDVHGAAFRLAGVDWPEDREFWYDVLARDLPDVFRLVRQGRCSIENDGFAPIRCVEPTGVAVAVVAGTGAAVAGRGPTGTEWSMSFWIQDGHAASSMVADALRAVYFAELGLGPATQLTERLLTFFGYATVEQMLREFTRRGGTPSRPAHTAAAEVSKAAIAGDVVAGEIVHDLAGRLADYAYVTAKRVGFDVANGEVPVVLAGSVLRGDDSPVTRALLKALPERLPGVRACVTTLPPVAGATLDALAEAGFEVSAEVVGRLRASLPVPNLIGA